MEQATKSDIKEIITKLVRLQRDMDSMKEYLEDVTLTEEEEKLLSESYENEKKDKLISQEELEKEIGI